MGHVGLIGLGQMGGPMSRNLMRGGYRLKVFDVDRAAVDRLVKEGRVETRSMDEFENSTKIMLRLAQRQHERVPVPPARDPAWVRPPFAMPGAKPPPTEG